MIKIVRARDYADMSRKAANIISAQVILKPNCVLGLATGDSPIGTYDQLIDWYKKGDVDFSQVSTYNLDEYFGIADDDPQSYHYFMNKHFFDHINIDPKTLVSAICSFWALAATAILASTSRTTFSPRARIAST